VCDAWPERGYTSGGADKYGGTVELVCSWTKRRKLRKNLLGTTSANMKLTTSLGPEVETSRWEATVCIHVGDKVPKLKCLSRKYSAYSCHGKNPQFCKNLSVASKNLGVRRVTKIKFHTENPIIGVTEHNLSRPECAPVSHWHCNTYGEIRLFHITLF
jgi:hypothetical protein